VNPHAAERRCRAPTWITLIVVALSTTTCTSSRRAVSGPTGRAFSAADVLFHRDSRWLGSDAAFSIPLAEGRTLWLFGDTFIAGSAARQRSDARMVSNTIAIQTGTDPRTAGITFHWRRDSAGAPASFFPDPEYGRLKYWPGHGIRLDGGPLVIFLYRIMTTPGQGLGFGSAGFAVAVVDHPDAPAATWHPRIIDAAPGTFDAVPATAVVQDGAYVVALAIRQEGAHAGALVRYPAASIAKGDLGRAEWWAGDARGWVPAAAVGAGGPAFIMDDAGAECSLHWDTRTGAFIHVASYGFGATTIGLRTAPALTGPWSAPIVVYRPPESDGSRPFVYAAKAHPELVGPDTADLVITYATNSFEFGDLFSARGADSLYWPRFVSVRLGR
jgi:hypothetical protein